MVKLRRSREQDVPFGRGLTQFLKNDAVTLDVPDRHRVVQFFQLSGGQPGEAFQPPQQLQVRKPFRTRHSHGSASSEDASAYGALGEVAIPGEGTIKEVYQSTVAFFAHVVAQVSTNIPDR
jgi:hypothetical protein